MLSISIKTNFPDVLRQLKQLQDDLAARALASALNKTTAQAKTAMSSEIRGEFNIGAAKVRDALVVRKASYRAGLFTMQASLESPSQRGRSLNLINFDARQTPQGVSIKIKKGGARKVIPGSFIGNGGRTVFIRIGKQRLPIKALQTINVAQMFNTKRINARVVQFIQDKLPAIFENEAKFFTDRFNLQRAAR